MLKHITDINDWKKVRKELNGKTIGFVPTMGALHEGHISLIRKSKLENDITLVSIFVNPTQFNDPNDLKNYPSDMGEDIRKLNEVKTDYLLNPTYEALYHDNYRYSINENDISNTLCGSSRHGHFEGVLTIVMKLLSIAKADRAYFGKKDYQQYLLIKGMAEAFFLETKIVPCEIVRETDGLAMSSRNQLLNSQDRDLAKNFHKHLNSEKPINEIKHNLEKIGFEVDYIEERFGRRFGAVKLGNVRLIDNV
jgi:pantoate--beta-alanine ligase